MYIAGMVVDNKKYFEGHREKWGYGDWQFQKDLYKAAWLAAKDDDKDRFYDILRVLELCFRDSDCITKKAMRQISKYMRQVDPIYTHQMLIGMNMDALVKWRKKTTEKVIDDYLEVLE